MADSLHAMIEQSGLFTLLNYVIALTYLCFVFGQPLGRQTSSATLRMAWHCSTFATHVIVG